MSSPQLVRFAPEGPGAVVEPLGPADPPPLAPSPPPALPKRINWAVLLSFSAMVLLPVAVYATYLMQHAADQYVARAQFTVHETSSRPLRLEDDDTTGLRLGQQGGADEVSTFTRVVASYLDSTALLRELSEELDIAAIYRRPEADFWARLPEPAAAETLEAYWRSMIRVAVGGQSGIVRLEVRAFRPQDARDLADGALAAAEALVNRLAHRHKADALDRATAEAAEAERRLARSVAALSEFQNAQGLLDPAREGGATLDLLGQLTTERIRLKSELRVLEQVVAPDAARARSLRSRIDTVTRDIADLRAGLADKATEDGNLAAALGRFEELEIRQRFAARLYGLSQARRIGAEIAMARQSVFLNLFDPPRLPETPSHPRRLALILIATAVLTAGWAILTLIVAAIADHRLDRQR